MRDEGSDDGSGDSQRRGSPACGGAAGGDGGGDGGRRRSEGCRGAPIPTVPPGGTGAARVGWPTWAGPAGASLPPPTAGRGRIRSWTRIAQPQNMGSQPLRRRAAAPGTSRAVRLGGGTLLETSIVIDDSRGQYSSSRTRVCGRRRRRGRGARGEHNGWRARRGETSCGDASHRRQLECALARWRCCVCGAARRGVAWQDSFL